MEEVGFDGIRKSVTKRQNTVAQYIATQPNLVLCEWATQWPGARVSGRWWEQAGIDLERANKRATEAETEEATLLELDLKAESRGASRSSGA